MNYARQWYYWSDNNDVEARGLAGTRTEPRMIYTDDYKLAVGTLWVFTDTLEDGSEFGLQVTETQVTWLPSEFIVEQIESAMDSYRAENGP